MDQYLNYVQIVINFMTITSFFGTAQLAFRKYVVLIADDTISKYTEMVVNNLALFLTQYLFKRLICSL